MPARRTPTSQLKLLSTTPREPATAAAQQAVLGGVGLDWDQVPATLDDAGRGEWTRLGEVYADQPVRFREGDRAALIAYCSYWSMFLAAQADVAKRGVIVIGRSQKDRGRKVKNPATVAMREAATQLRYWARELGLTPDARGRIGVDEHAGPPVVPGDPSNPFA